MPNANNNLLQDIDSRTKLVGHNRLELLLFRLSGKQRYGINVFKVREVVAAGLDLAKVPHAHTSVLGITNMRGNTFMVIDLQSALGMQPLTNHENCSVIVTEYNRKIQGFMVPHIEHIMNKHWEEILAPPKVAGKGHYLTGVTQVEDEIIEILDVEKVLFEILGDNPDDLNAEADTTQEVADVAKRCHVLIADDSSVARNQMKRTLAKLDIPVTACNDGRAALEQLQNWSESNAEEFQRLAMVISDVEMPEMDGYTLTSEIRNNDKLKDLTVVLHTSLSGVFNSSLLESVKADGFLAKFDADELLEEVTKNIEKFSATLDSRGL